MDKYTVGMLLDKEFDKMYNLTLFRSTDTVQSALSRLAGAKILSAPVRFDKSDGTCTWKMLDMMDITLALIHEGSNSKILDDTIDKFCNLSRLNVIVPISKPETLATALNLLTNVHRLVVLDDYNDMPVSMISQMDILKWALKHSDCFHEEDRRIFLEEVMTKNPMCTNESEPLIDALKRFTLVHRYGGIAVVNQSGVLVGNLSISDLRGLTYENMGEIFKMNVGEFLKSKKRYFEKPPVFLQPKQHLGDAVNLMRTEHVHRIYVVDQEQKPIGIMTTTDVMKHLDQRQAAVRAK